MFGQSEERKTGKVYTADREKQGFIFARQNEPESEGSFVKKTQTKMETGRYRKLRTGQDEKNEIDFGRKSER